MNHRSHLIQSKNGGAQVCLCQQRDRRQAFGRRQLLVIVRDIALGIDKGILSANVLFVDIDVFMQVAGKLVHERADVGLKARVAHPLRADLEGRAVGEPSSPNASANTIAGLKHDDRALRLARSEEHTSELQSLAYLVCRLLLEKKKKKKNKTLYNKTKKKNTTKTT